MNATDRPSAYQPTPESLARAIRSLMEGANAEIQVEASRLMVSLIELRPTASPDELSLVESAIAALSAKSANVQVAKFLRNRLEISQRNRRSGLVPWISRNLSDSPVYAMLIGVVVSACVWAIIFVAVLGGSELWVNWFSATDHTSPPETAYIMPRREVLPLVFGALLGGLVSLLSRTDSFANLYIFDPFLVFLNSFLKPLIGSVLAITVYAILKSKLIEVSGLSLDVGPDDFRYIFWAFGFLAGFSERLTGDFISRAETVVTRHGATRNDER